MNFDQAFDLLMGHEGGFSNHPSDPGGATRWGVTARVALKDGYTGDMRHFPRDRAKSIYKRLYWDAVKADHLPAPLRYSVFDAAVNSGVSQAAKWLQRAVGALEDGQIGPVTLAAANVGNPHRLVMTMNAARLQFMTDLPTWGAFSRGWVRRIAAILSTT